MKKMSILVDENGESWLVPSLTTQQPGLRQGPRRT